MGLIYEKHKMEERMDEYSMQFSRKRMKASSEWNSGPGMQTLDHVMVIACHPRPLR